MLKTWLEFERPLESVLGIDEAGRGPLAGPCVVVGVILPLGFNHPLINDSKQLSAKQRSEALKVILDEALYIDIITVTPLQIDTLNIYQATKQAMMTLAHRAPVQLIFTDAMPFKLEGKMIEDYIKGDSRSISIAAASIVAKEMRDHIMMFYDRRYPMYNFKQHKGYPTKAHVEALMTYGPCPIHRRSYAPVQESLRLTLFK